MPDSQPRMIVLFSSDLMLISSVGGAATAMGHRFCSVSSLTDAVQKLESDGSMLCLDLSASESNPQAIAAAVSNYVLSHSVAFGPHVHTARLEQAKLAGFPRVMSRGQFVSKMTQLFMDSP
jgi:hypothetical protein